MRPPGSDASLIQPTDRGLHCAAGGFHIDPWQPVDRALITHGHADHARPGSTHYLCATPAQPVLKQRLQQDADIDTLDFGQTRTINGVKVSFHPAGHLLGSAQIRLEHAGHITVVTGDYKRDADPTCEPFEPLRCHTLITESTFGLPVYRWPPRQRIIDDIHHWWHANQQQHRTSVLFAYALGKAQRVIAALDDSVGPILAHGAVMRFVDVYRAANIAMPNVQHADDDARKQARGRGIVIAPPSTLGTPWLRKLAPYATGYVSGWMLVRGARRWRSVDRGFPLSDHADWPGLLQTIKDSGAETIGVTHGQSSALVRYLREHGHDAHTLPTRYNNATDTEDNDE